MGPKEYVSFAEVEDDTLVASFANEEDKEWALNHGPWLHLGCPVLVARWEAGKKLEKLLKERMQLVVQIHDLPLQMRSEGTAKRCAVVAGTVLGYIKPYRSATQNVQRQKFYKFKVEVDLRRPLAPGCFLGNQKDNPPRAKFRYEKLPNLCLNCGLFDHDSFTLCQSNIKGADQF